MSDPVFKAASRIYDLRDAGLPEYAVYATALVGFLVTAQSQGTMTEEMVKEYDDAVADYKANPIRCAEALRRLSKRT